MKTETELEISNKVESIKNVNKDLLNAMSYVIGCGALERVERFDILEMCKSAVSKAEKLQKPFNS